MQTEAQKAIAKRYRQSAKGKEAQKRYAESDKGKASLKRRVARYQQSKKDIEAIARQKPNRDAYRKTIIGHLRRTYANVMRRCNDSGHRAYKWYGGRGIKVHFESSDDFVNYVINELQIDPRDLECDRIKNDGNYERGNIRFVTHKENCQNR